MTQFQEYAKIKRLIKGLEAKAAEIETELIQELSETQGNKLETTTATFSLMSSVKFEYSPELQEKEKLVKEKLKFMKKEEETSGKAHKVKDGWTLRCQLAKEL